MCFDFLDVSTKKVFAPELAEVVSKNPEMFKYLSEGKQPELRASFVLDPSHDPKKIDLVLESLIACDDMQVLLEVPTIYRRGFPRAVLEKMKVFADDNRKMLAQGKYDILRIALGD